MNFRNCCDLNSVTIIHFIFMVCYHDAVFFPASACTRNVLSQIKSLRASLAENYLSIKDSAKLKYLSRGRVPTVGNNGGECGLPGCSLPGLFPPSHSGIPALLCFPRPQHLCTGSGYAHELGLHRSEWLAHSSPHKLCSEGGKHRLANLLCPTVDFYLP